MRVDSIFYERRHAETKNETVEFLAHPAKIIFHIFFQQAFIGWDPLGWEHTIAYRPGVTFSSFFWASLFWKPVGPPPTPPRDDFRFPLHFGHKIKKKAKNSLFLPQFGTYPRSIFAFFPCIFECSRAQKQIITPKGQKKTVSHPPGGTLKQL